jgi:NAD(P)-dependent dehydrogenase (short-subunit alcohol dehydrogenase family)
MRLDDRNALVTGAARGIGYGCARRLLADGARVLLVDVDDEAGERAARELSEGGAGDRVAYLHCDVADSESVQAAVEQVVEDWGGIDIAVANAAVVHAADFLDLEEADFDRVLAELRERDRRDSARAASPLKPAEDAHLLDTTDLGIEAAFKAAVELIDAATG